MSLGTTCAVCTGQAKVNSSFKVCPICLHDNEQGYSFFCKKCTAEFVYSAILYLITWNTYFIDMDTDGDRRYPHYHYKYSWLERLIQINLEKQIS